MDICFSGFALHDAEYCMHALHRSSANWQPTKVQYWDDHERVQESSFGAGTKIDDSFGILEYDFANVRQITFHISDPSDLATCQLNLYRCRERQGLTEIDGPVFIRNDAGRFWIESVMQFLARELSALITLADEDDEDSVISQMPLIIFPQLLVVSNFRLSPQLRTFLSSNGQEVYENSGVYLFYVPEELSNEQGSKIYKEWITGIMHGARRESTR